MKRVFLLLLSESFLAVGCGPVAQAPRDDREVEVGYGTTPKEIKSIDILKDSSTAIYGVRGANGVILIRLKR